MKPQIPKLHSGGHSGGHASHNVKVTANHTQEGHRKLHSATREGHLGGLTRRTNLQSQPPPPPPATAVATLATTLQRTAILALTGRGRPGGWMAQGQTVFIVFMSQFPGPDRTGMFRPAIISRPDRTGFFGPVKIFGPDRTGFFSPV